MSDSSLISLVAPLLLIFMMLGMGLSLRVVDFTRLIWQPVPILVGLAAQIIGVPLVAVLLIHMINMQPELAVGFMILAACPGGPGSNILSFICRANPALSVTLTALSSCLAFITIPFVTNMALSGFMQSKQDLSVANTVVLVLFITLVPLMFGMFCSRLAPNFAAKAEPLVRKGSVAGLLILVVLVFYRARNELAGLIEQVGLAVVLLCLLTIGLGFLISRLANLAAKDQKTIAMEVGIQNSALAIVVASNLLENPTMAIPAAIYSPVMITASALFVLHFGFSQFRLQRA